MVRGGSPSETRVELLRSERGIDDAAGRRDGATSLSEGASRGEAAEMWEAGQARFRTEW